MAAAQDCYLGRRAVDDARREWEVYRYLRPLQNLKGTPGYPSASPTVSGPVASHDRALTAFAQLGALRLNCRRGIISLLDRRLQYIVAEGTRTLSLQDDQIHGPEDDLWLGATTIPRGDTPCGYASGLLIPPEIESRDNETGKGVRDYVVFPNLKNNPRFAHQPFTEGPKPNGRFYAGVPIISPDGFNIGVYCVLDDKPRDGLTSAEIDFLRDMARTVMSHLVMVRAKDELQRSQKMVQGLSKFQYRQSSDDKDSVDIVTPKQRRQKAHSRRTSVDLNDRSNTCNVRSTCQRAANIIRDVADFDGVVLLDASISKVSTQEPSSRARTSSSTSSNPDLISPIDYSTSTYGDHEQSCAAVLGSSLIKRPLNSALPDVSLASPVKEEFVQALLRKYPSGKIWTDDPIMDKLFESLEADTDSSELSKTAREDYLERQVLKDLFPGFHSLAVVGLRHSAGSRWFAASVVWTCSPTRVFSQDGELAYLVAFGSSVMSELARLDVKVADQAKTAFISSISHELRTPLHGIMGSLECLQTTEMDGFQSDLLNTIDTCNQTLLDIFDNLLSFASIDKLVKNNKHDDTDPDSSSIACKKAKSLGIPSGNVDLRALVQGVVETILAGRRFVHNSAKQDSGPGSNFDASRGAVNLLLDFEGTGNTCWNFHTQPGGWRRLILNLITNGLKYTEHGSVSVRLSSKPFFQNSSRVTMTVTDTGKGMSPEFLRMQLFNPFVQEDPLAPGTGLGLSICKDIVTGMGGDITVTSEQGKGSQFEISMILECCSPQTEQIPLPSPSTILSGKCFKDHLKVGRLTVLGAPEPVNPKGNLGSLFTMQCLAWLGLTTSISSEMKDEDFIIASEEEVKTLKTPLQRPLIVVRNMYIGSNFTMPAEIAPHVEFLTQPWTPLKLATAISACMDANLAPVTGVARIPPQSSTMIVNKAPTPPINTSNPFKIPCSPKTPSEPSLPEISVLLVDDNPINVQLLATFMKKQKYHYDIAINGQEAVDLYRSFNAKQIDGAAKKSYHYILMDINMPVMDGIEATRKIREYEGNFGLKPSSIVMLTGAGSPEIQQEAFASGADTFLTKPVRLKQLGKMLQDLA